ncbi:unnamed protein product [Rhodiola kirilowii]
MASIAQQFSGLRCSPVSSTRLTDTVRGSDGIGAEEEERADCVRDNIGEYADEGEAEAEGAV